MSNKRTLIILLTLWMTITGCAAFPARATEPAYAKEGETAVSPLEDNNATYLPKITSLGVAANSNGSLGSNLTSFTDWSTEHPLTDYFKSSRQWITQCNNGSDPGCNNVWDTEESALLDLDANGWVRSLPAQADAPVYTFVSTILFTAEPHQQEGTYIVLYEGEGTISYDFGAVKDVGLSGNGRDVVNLAANGAFLLSITATDPQGNGNYIRNIHIVKPEHEADYQTNLFNPDFLAKLDGFRTLRYMNWMETNANTQQVWSDYTQMGASTYTNEEGVPLELMVALSNQTGKSPWFNMPHAGTDDYFTQFATHVRDNLDPNLPVHVEFSNEVWNSLFEQHYYAQAQGIALFNSGDIFQDTINWHGKRTAEMCDIWKAVFGSQSERVVCVMGSQVNQWVSEQALSCPLWNGGPCADHGIDALAIAPYFGIYIGSPEYESTVTQWAQEADGGLNSLFAELTNGGLLPGGGAPPNGAMQQSFEWMTANKTVANTFNVELIAYEGGQHLTGVGEVANNDAITNLFIAANRDPRMGNLYTQYLTEWKTRGGNLFAIYRLIGTSDKWGSWGLLEHINQTSSPKYDAVHNFATTIPCWWTGCSKPVAPQVSITAPSGNMAQINWTHDDTFVSYKVWRSGDPYFTPPAELLGTVAAAPWQWTDATALGDVSTNHFYLVEGVQADGGSRFSNHVGEFDFALATG